MSIENQHLCRIRLRLQVCKLQPSASYFKTDERYISTGFAHHLVLTQVNSFMHKFQHANLLGAVSVSGITHKSMQPI